MKIGIYTLGCKVNQYETQAMEQELTARGHELVDFESPADNLTDPPMPTSSTPARSRR